MRLSKKLMVVMGGGKRDVFSLTCTTTGAATLTLAALTVDTSKTVTVDWGDAQSNVYTAGAGARTHNYAGAGTYAVRMVGASGITLLDLRDTKLSGVISGINPLPTGLTSLTLVSLPSLTYNVNAAPLPTGLTDLSLYNMAGVTYNANTNPLPTGLTTLYINNLPSLTYNANTNPLPAGLTSLTLNTLAGLTYNANTDPLPAGLTTLYLNNLAGLTYNANTDPLPAGLTSLSLVNSANLTQAQVDAVLAGIYANRANYTYATPTLDLLGTGNAAPSGAYADENPPTTGNGYKYELVVDPQAEGFKKWAITTA